MTTSPDPDLSDTTDEGRWAEPSPAAPGSSDEAWADPSTGSRDLPPDGAGPLGAVRREVVLEAPAERVWAALADDDGLAGWLADEVDLEVREGATGTVRDDGEAAREVTVEEVVPGRRLGLAWRDVDDRPSLVDLVIEPVGADRTRVVVVEVPVATLRLVAPAAERMLAVGRPGAGSSGGISASAAGPGRCGPGPAPVAAYGPGRLTVGQASVARCALAGVR